MNYISVKEVAMLWNVSERWVQKLCESNRIDGAVVFGGAWAIPSYAQKPQSTRKKRNNINSKNSDIRIEEQLFGKQMRTLNKSSDCTVFMVENESGNGVISHYELFKGVEVFYNDFHMMNGFEQKGNLSDDIIEINHCREGRCECILKDGQVVYVGKDDLSLNSLSNQAQKSNFPLAHYHGISIIINIKEVSEIIHSISSQLGGFDINLEVLKSKLSGHYHIVRANEAIGHIFSELYHSPDRLRKNYLTLKILELLFFLCIYDFEYNPDDRVYLRSTQVNLIKEIKAYIMENISKKITLEMLAEKFNVPITALKNNFKAVYGTPISIYIRGYRLQLASELLLHSDKSILEISEYIGYENQTNFTEAFKKLYGTTPTLYRKIPVQKED